MWPSMCDRRFDGEGPGKEGRGRAVELPLPHPRLWTSTSPESPFRLPPARVSLSPSHVVSSFSEPWGVCVPLMAPFHVLAHLSLLCDLSYHLHQLGPPHKQDMSF